MIINDVESNNEKIYVNTHMGRLHRYDGEGGHNIIQISTNDFQCLFVLINHRDLIWLKIIPKINGLRAPSPTFMRA